jgi:hypothetical protein
MASTMPAYLITYDLQKPGKNYDALYDKIKSYGTWARVTESNWVVVSDKSAIAIRDDLLTVMDVNDRLLVVRSGVESGWNNPRCDSEWLLKHL